MSDREYEELIGRIRSRLVAGDVLVEIWDLRDKTVMSDAPDNRRTAEEYRFAFVHQRLVDGTRGELLERHTIRRMDEGTLCACGATLRGQAAPR